MDHEASGFGLIETIRVREGQLPLLDRHLARFERSRSALGLPRPRQDIAALVQPFAGIGEGVLRVEVTGDRAMVTVRAVPSLDPVALITASEPHQPYPHKTTARDCFQDAAEEADIAEADDALLLTHEGFAAEGTVWSLFWWEADGTRLVTPGLGLGVLPGIGRARVNELMAFAEASARRAELDGKSLFLVNAVRGIVPIASLDGVALPADPRTATLARSFWPATLQPR